VKNVFRKQFKATRKTAPRTAQRITGPLLMDWRIDHLRPVRGRTNSPSTKLPGKTVDLAPGGIDNRPAEHRALPRGGPQEKMPRNHVVMNSTRFGWMPLHSEHLQVMPGSRKPPGRTATPASMPKTSSRPRLPKPCCRAASTALRKNRKRDNEHQQCERKGQRPHQRQPAHGSKKPAPVSKQEEPPQSVVLRQVCPPAPPWPNQCRVTATPAPKKPAAGIFAGGGGVSRQVLFLPSQLR